MTTVVSPITGSSNTELVGEFSKEEVVSAYKMQYDIDVMPLLNGSQTIQLWRCKDSEYQFFFPLGLGGDAGFYAHFQKFSWYYIPNKWEHHALLSSKLNFNTVLEVGCGTGAFLKMAKAKFSHVQVVGLELNSDAVKEATEQGVNVEEHSVEDYRVDHSEQYDLVCSFQVLEHISDPFSFLSAQAACVKPGGYLSIAVPNNESFIRFDDFNILNLPPHHMGRWNRQSLLAMGRALGLRVVNVLYEPLQPYHVQWYQRIIESRLVKGTAVKMLYYKFRFDKILRLLIGLIRHWIRGHTIMVIFQK